MAVQVVALEEQETTVNIYPSQIQDFAEIYSSIPATIKKLRKFAEENPDEVKIQKEDGVGLFAQVPAKWVQIRKPKQMNLTDEQRAAAAERLRNARVANDRQMTGK